MQNASTALGWASYVAVAASLAASPAFAAGGERALGEHLASECATCHLTSGRQVGGIPAIVGQPADQFVALMSAYRERQRDNQVMQAIAARLSTEEFAALAAYYETLKSTP